jgi:hypothetical protein
MSPEAVRAEKLDMSNWSMALARLDDAAVPTAPETPESLKTSSSSEAPTFDAVALTAVPGRKALVMKVSLVG